MGRTRSSVVHSRHSCALLKVRGETARPAERVHHPGLRTSVPGVVGSNSIPSFRASCAIGSTAAARWVTICTAECWSIAAFTSANSSATSGGSPSSCLARAGSAPEPPEMVSLFGTAARTAADSSRRAVSGEGLEAVGRVRSPPAGPRCQVTHGRSTRWGRGR